MPNFYKHSYILSLRLIKALRLSVTPALLCSDGRCIDSRPPHDVTNFEFNLYKKSNYNYNYGRPN